ncbi:MAG TPA: peptidoglycan bridge formation glycyltransferase FemA/FemB family protein [Bellilinea sp.]|nr:peptidoglycan bridge formation glycyltransferase FemA/FemB family protein [Bellilinea sp.]
MTTVDAAEWQSFLNKHPQHHLLQTPAWGALKNKFGWKSRNIVVGDSGAQILFRKLPLGYTVAYIPKGPVGIPSPEFWSSLDKLCMQEKAIFLKVEPDKFEGATDEIRFRQRAGEPSASIQPRQTIIIDLSGDKDTWLSRMKQKTRYNIRLAEKKGIVVRQSNDIDEFYSLMTETGSRDAFGVHSKAYYQAAFDLFSAQGKASLLTAYFEEEPVASVMIFAQGERAWYFYGASSDRERNRMPAYLVQFEAMRWAKTQGCVEYDLWGIPDAKPEELEANFETRSDGLWGVYRFKRGFGGEIKRYAEAYDVVYKPLIYKLYKLYAGRKREDG